MWNKEIYVNNEIFTYFNDEMDLFFLKKQLSAHQNLSSSCGITCRRRNNVKSGLLLARLWVKNFLGVGPHRQDGQKIRKLKSYAIKPLQVRKS